MNYDTVSRGTESALFVFEAVTRQLPETVDMGLMWQVTETIRQVEHLVWDMRDSEYLAALGGAHSEQWRNYAIDWGKIGAAA